MNSGTAKIRGQLPDLRKSATIRAVLIITPTAEDRWRTRAITDSGECLDPVDHLGVAFLDEAIGERTTAFMLFWLFVLTFGRSLARVRSYFRIRSLMIGLALRDSRHCTNIPLIHLDHDDNIGGAQQTTKLYEPCFEPSGLLA